MVEYFDGIGVVVYYYVGEVDIVVCCKVCCYNVGEYGFFVEFDIVEGFEG